VGEVIDMAQRRQARQRPSPTCTGSHALKLEECSVAVCRRCAAVNIFAGVEVKCVVCGHDTACETLSFVPAGVQRA
jgi:hypothetical protein